jgi:hypothetical protein
MHAVVRPPSVPEDSGIKKPDAGKGVAVLNPVVKQKTGDAALASKGGHFEKVGDDDYVGPSGKHFNYNQVKAYYSNGGSWDGMSESLQTGEGTASPTVKMDWMPQGQYEQEQKGLKKAVAARKKSDKAAKAQAILRRAAPQAPAAPFVPKVQFGGPGSGPHGKTSTASYKATHAFKRGKLGKSSVAPWNMQKATQAAVHRAIQPEKNVKAAEHHVMVKSGGNPGVYYAKSKHGTFDEAMQEAAKHKGAFVQSGGKRHDVKAADVTVSKTHPINPLKIKPPKGSQIAPLKSIAPVSVSPGAMREKAVLRKGRR